MKSNIGFVGSSYKWFIGQVPPGQNQHVKTATWQDAHGDRVKVRIPGQHPKTAEVTDDNLPWAIVAKPTSSGNINRTSSGIWGGEWVIGFYMDEGCQIPVITHVLGRANIEPEMINSVDGTTNLKNVSSYTGGYEAGNHQIIGGSSKKSDPRTLPVDSKIKEDAKTDPKTSDTTSTGTQAEVTALEQKPTYSTPSPPPPSPSPSSPPSQTTNTGPRLTTQEALRRVEEAGSWRASGLSRFDYGFD